MAPAPLDLQILDIYTYNFKISIQKKKKNLYLAPQKSKINQKYPIKFTMLLIQY